MTLQELGSALSQMYFESSKGEAVAMIHLFGIKYAEEIRESGESMKAIALAGASQSPTELKSPKASSSQSTFN